MSKLNSNTLMIAAVVLVVLALVVMATPLMRVSGISSSRTGFTRPTNGQTFTGGQNRTFGSGTGSGSGSGTGTQGQGFTGPTGGFQGQGNSTTTGRQFAGRSSSLLRITFLNGMTGIIIYAFALLVSLAAAVGMFITRRWGQILGIVMAVVYFLLALVSFLPMILLGFARALTGLTLGLDILRVVLALAVIVLALIPARKVLVPATPASPAAPATPPAASA